MINQGESHMSLSNGPFWSGVITLLAIVLYQYMGARVGILRGKLGIKAPATTGDPTFERASRVHLNTGEQYIAFIPLLWLATGFFHALPWLPAVFGAMFLIARVVYMRLYMTEPDSRIPAAFGTMLSILGLIVLSAIGLVQAATA
jgi:glutathione S-transferase